MRSVLFPIAAGLAVVLAGCKSEQEQLTEYNAAFITSCETDATKHGISPGAARHACACALTEFDRKYPGASKISNPLSEAAPLVQACAIHAAGGTVGQEGVRDNGEP